MKKIVPGIAATAALVGASAAPASADQPDLTTTKACHGQVIGVLASTQGIQPTDTSQYTPAGWNKFIKDLCATLNG